MGKWPQYTKWFQKLWMTKPLFQNWLEYVICDHTKDYCSIYNVMYN